ncbi:MAG: hypothetical protein QM535_03695 [Limnohabitans sp.]|nr:hypothetical protein [Limnohabitans sp.]
MKKTTTYPVLPNSVYVWRGFKSSSDFEKFYNFLGSVFVPSCALLQPNVGLRAYLPTLIPQTNKPNAVPDQTALMFWATPESHDEANETVAVRAYQNLHGDVYDMSRSHLPEVPTLFPKKVTDIQIEQPYFLFKNKADWMLGSVKHLVAARPDTISTGDFTQLIFNWVTQLQTAKIPTIDAALVCNGNDYLVVWIHSTNEKMDWTGIVQDFESQLTVQLNTVLQNFEMKTTLWSNWAGIDYSKEENYALNIQLNRPRFTKPKKVGL